MARTSFLGRIVNKFKEWVSGGNKSNNSSRSSGSARSSGGSQRTNYYSSSRKDGGRGYYRRSMLNSLTGKEEEEKPKYKSMATATKSESQKQASSFAKLDSALKKDVPDPKQAARLKSKENAKDMAAFVKKWNESNKQQKKEFNERTNHKYDVKYWEEKGDKKKAQEARIRVKSGENTSDIVAEELAVKYHPIAYSAARGAASGATFGASELAIKAQAKRDEERAKNEQYYQEHKNKAAEGVGELVGAFASFGGTAGATEKLGAKVVSKAAPRAAERLAEKKVVQGLAKRGVNKAVKKGLVSEASEELIKQVGKEKAKKIVAAVGNDIVQNATTGLLYDFNKASAAHEIGSKEWWKEMGTSAAFNAAITGGVAGGAILGGNKKAAVEAASELAKKSAPARRAQGQILGRAMANEKALDRSFVLPEENIRIKDLVENTQAAQRAKRASTLDSLRANAEAKLPTSSGSTRLEDLINVPTRKSTTLNEIDKELDGVYASLQRKDLPQEEREALTERFSALMDERNIVENNGGEAGEIMYHAGDTGKAEWYGNQAGSRRDTGHFGTGTYLAGEEDILKNEGYGNRPLWEVDAGKYYKWRPKDAEQGRRVHYNLGKLNKASGDIEEAVKGVDFDSKEVPALLKAADDAYLNSDNKALKSIADKLFTKQDMESIEEAAEQRLKGWEEYNAGIEEYNKDLAARRAAKMSELDLLDDEALDDYVGSIYANIDIDDLFFDNSDAFRRLDSISDLTDVPREPIEKATYEDAFADELSRAITKRLEDIQEYGGDWDGWADSLAKDLGTTKQKVKQALKLTQDVIDRYNKNQVFIKEDSASTIFMKALGYEGVNNKGIEGLDNTEYGSVIYDLLSKDAKLIKEGKAKGAKPTAKMLNPQDAWEEVVEDIPFTADNGKAITGKEIPMPQPTQTKGTRKAAENLKPAADDWAGDYKGVEDDIPVDNLNQTRLNDANAEAQARAKRVMEEPPKADESSAKGAAKQTSEAAEEAGEREFTQGQKEAREAFYKKTGTKLDEGKAATDDQILESLGNYERSQGTSAERKLSKVAFSQVAVSTDEAAEKLLKMQDEGAFGYDVVHHADMYKEVANDLENDWDRWIDKICDVAEGGDWSGKESTKLLYMSQYLAEVTDAAKSPEQDALSTMAYKAIQKLSTTSAQTMNGRRAYAHLSKAGKMECALDDMVAILDPAIGFNKQHRKAMMGLNKYERQHYIKGQLLKDEKLKGCLKKLANAKTNDEISEAYTEMLYQFNKSNPKSGFDVVQELRYLNMLGNPKTHIRNMFGSGFFAPMRQVSNMIRGGIEDRIAKEAGLEITKHGGLSLSAAKEAWAKEPKTEAGKAALEAFESVKKDLLGSAKYDTPTYAGRGKTLAGKAVDKLSDFNSSLLSKEDDFFKSRAFKENYIKSYNKYLKDGVPITDKIKKQIEQEAFQEAQIATFNEYNEFAKWLSNITRKANDANASTLARWGARGVNAVMPFTKVPANLMKQSINYSPIGIAKGMLNIKQAAKKGDAVLLNRAIDELASGLTGTGVFGLGMLLGKTTDMFTTNTGKNDPAAKFKKDRGMQNYSITFKDPETGQGHSFTLDWLVPMSATFFSGVEMANQLKRGDFDILDIGNDWSTVMTRLAEPVMETSMLSGLHGMLETMRGGSDSDDTKSAIQVLLRETAQSYMSSLIPTALGQASRTAYKTDMQITGDDDWEYFWNQTKSKAGLANTNILGEALGADTDAYGNIKGEKNSASDYVKSGLKNFLSPANIQKVDFSEVDNEKLRVYEDAVKNGADPNDMAYLFPKKQYKKQFSVAGEDVKMSNKDLSTYNQAKTKGGEEGMRYILESIMFNRYDYDSKGKKVPTAEAYTKAEKQALMEQFRGKSMREVEEWLYQQPEFKNASKAEQKKAISGLWGLSKDTKTVASQRVGEQAVYKAQGKDVNEYNYKNEITESKRDQLQPYIDSGLLTYEEAVDFARNGGKVSYTEDEDGGGSATTYYSKAAMIDYFVEHGIPYDKAEALYNAFKAKNAKPYSGNNKSSGRRGYGGYRRGGGGSRKAKVPKIDAKSMASATKKSKGTTVKLEPPTPKTTKVTTKFRKYDI